jgi:hypothetical protein
VYAEKRPHYLEHNESERKKREKNNMNTKHINITISEKKRERELCNTDAFITPLSPEHKKTHNFHSVIKLLRNIRCTRKFLISPLASKILFFDINNNNNNNE